MASNMWTAVDDHCEICNREFGVPMMDKVHEDGTPVKLHGSTIEDDDGNMLTLCTECLSDLVRQDWEQLKWNSEDGRP